MSGQHALLAPSSAPIWGYCSGSVAAAQAAPPSESEATREGTAAHWVVSQCLANFRSSEQGLPLTADHWLGQTDPDGTLIDRKMVEGAAVMVSDVLQVAQEHGALRSLLIEHRTHMPQIHEQNWGTLDCALPLVALGVPKIYVWDYKHGHRENRPEANLQLIDYMAGLLAELNINGQQDQHIDVHFRIVQPFCYSAPDDVNEWVVKLADLRPYFNRLRAQAHEALGPNPTMTAGKHCRDCPAVWTCATARRAVYSFIDYAGEPYRMDQMTDADLAVERGILQDGMAVAKARLEAIEDTLTHKLRNGSVGSGLALESKPGRLAWSVPPKQAVAFASQFGVDNSVLGVLTPTQTADKVAAPLRAAFKQAVNALASRPAGALKLINASDTIAARAFKRR